MKTDTSYWQGKTCLVTGGTGFIGSWLCGELYDLGARVVNIDIEPCHERTAFALLNNSRNIKTVVADLSERASVDLVCESKPSTIFHLAGTPYAPWTTDHPDEARRANVVTTENVLKAALRVDAERVVLASSACVFGAAQFSPLKVDDEVSPPEHYYTFSKREAEAKVCDFHATHGLPSVICRFVNVYGPGDRHVGRVVPQICKQIIEEQADTIQLRRSTGESVFEFLYVKDAVAGLLTAASYGSLENRVFHFGPGAGSRMNIRELAGKLSTAYDGKERPVKGKELNPEKRVEKYLDLSETKESLSWEATYQIDAGIEETIPWYKENLSRIDQHVYE
jgi:nucleoside-diphosphate-sugar epimerase